GTFQAGYNEQKQCSTCTKCDAGLGLKVKKSCSSTSDAVCEVLDGFFCSDSNRGGCRAAQSHRLSCSPGHYIDQRGMHVNRHCTEFRSTSCASCTEGTFQDGNNGREQCFSCKHCDAGLGLKVKKSCSSTSDAVCEVLDGFFCSDSNRGGCRAAQSHRLSCSPGHYIDQRGWCSIYCTDTLIINKLLNKLTSSTIIYNSLTALLTCYCIVYLYIALICRRRLKVSVITGLIQNTIICVTLAGSGGVIR
uniref:TNFR-Cys domain-containing protein n=1 Tax=Gadus morhua TaxID=8049 RepID=A0A8C5FBA0_GADMO